jgi:hypothetical protein
MINWENRPIHFGPKPLKDDPHMMEILSDKKERYYIKHPRPTIDDFVDVPKETRDQDKLELLKTQEMFEKNLDSLDEEQREIIEFNLELSSIFEVCILDVIENNKMLGNNCGIFPTSKWDDIKNGIDGVFVLDKEEQNEYLGGIEMDITFSLKFGDLESKLEGIKQNIRLGKLPTLKYFRDSKSGERKEISLPKVIIGAERASAEALLRMWGMNKANQNQDNLKNHPIQSKIIMEFIAQLQYFYSYAKELYENTKEPNMAEKYLEIRNKYAYTFNYIHEEAYLPNLSLINSHEKDIESDRVYKKILEISKFNLRK